MRNREGEREGQNENWVLSEHKEHIQTENIIISTFLLYLYSVRGSATESPL